jgi:sarcosine oxidase, subunit gamma
MGERTAEAVRLIRHRGGTVVSVRASEPARGRVAQALGLDALPSTNRTAGTAWGACLWVRPDGWLVTGADELRSTIIAVMEAAVDPNAGAVIDVSASRVRIELSGHASRDLLASCCPLDVHPRHFKTGDCAQSLIAKAPILLHLVDQTPCWHLYVRPSLHAYVVAWLEDAMPARVW